MKKVLFAIGSLQLGGAETVLVDILNKLDKQFDIDLLLIEKEGPLLERVSHNIHIKGLIDNSNSNSSKIFFAKVYKSLIYRFLYKSKLYCKWIYNRKLKKTYDVEIGFLVGVPCDIVKNSPNKKSKKIMWIHADVPKSDVKTCKKYSRVYRFFDKIIGVSASSIDTFKKTFPDSGKKISLIYNYVDVEKIINKSMNNMDNEFFSSSKLNFISVGRLVADKAYERIVDIACDFKQNIHFNIIGEGNERYKLEDMIQKKQISNVNLLGIKKNPYPYIKKSDVFLLSSRSEAYPTVVIEAMILNKFIIATDVPGVREILSGYNDKIIVENSKDGISKGIREYLKKNQKQCNVKNNDKFIVRNDSNLQKVVDLLNEE